MKLIANMVQILTGVAILGAACSIVFGWLVMLTGFAGSLGGVLIGLYFLSAGITSFCFFGALFVLVGACRKYLDSKADQYLWVIGKAAEAHIVEQPTAVSIAPPTHDAIKPYEPGMYGI